MILKYKQSNSVSQVKLILTLAKYPPTSVRVVFVTIFLACPETMAFVCDVTEWHWYAVVAVVTKFETKANICNWKLKQRRFWWYTSLCHVRVKMFINECLLTHMYEHATVKTDKYYFQICDFHHFWFLYNEKCCLYLKQFSKLKRYYKSISLRTQLVPLSIYHMIE